MGWEVHMTRAHHWPDSDQRPITAAGWLAVVSADQELRIDEANGPHFAVWSGPCSYPDDGRISTKNPDRAILGKMLALAAELGAVVQGDDGEVYSRPEDLPPDEAVAAARQRPWWRFW